MKKLFYTLCAALLFATPLTHTAPPALSINIGTTLDQALNQYVQQYLPLGRDAAITGALLCAASVYAADTAHYCVSHRQEEPCKVRVAVGVGLTAALSYMAYRLGTAYSHL